MSIYNTILLAVDLSSEAEQLISRAKQVAESNKATVHLIHVIEPLSFAYGGDVPLDLSEVQSQLDEHAKSKLELFANKLDYPVEAKHVVTGNIESEIHRVGDQISADLIIVGSHGRHGLALLLGSTANGVLHGAHCDVLAVRVQPED